jgi:hypothetical protein
VNVVDNAVRLAVPPRMLMQERNLPRPVSTATHHETTKDKAGEVGHTTFAACERNADWPNTPAGLTSVGSDYATTSDRASNTSGSDFYSTHV